MKLEKLRVQNYKSIDDSGWVPIHDVTSLVGKNEAGKTAFMQAVEKLNPSYGSGSYIEYKEYPRSDWIEYENRRDRGEPAAIVASAEFNLEESDKEDIRLEYRDDILTDDTVVLKKDFDNNYYWELSIDESVVIDSFLDDFEIPDRTEEKLRRSTGKDELVQNIQESKSDSESLDEIREQIKNGAIDNIESKIGGSILRAKIPEFRYMGDYSILDSIVNIDQMITKESNDNLNESDIVFMSLLSVANLNLQELKSEPDWERIITRLEASSTHVTDYMMNYWTQNENVRIRFHKDTATPEGPSKFEEGEILQIRVENVLKDVTMDFDQRSRGFRWFFSSFCHFSEIRDNEDNLILLLDEPGLHLHAKAQQDFLEFLDQQLSEEHTVIYSTHSPFMIDPRNLHRAQLVMADPEGHTNITTDILKTDKDTRFPLQTVFEFDLIDTLLIRPQTMLVEGKSDQIFIYTMSKILEEGERTSLDKKWTVLNVGSGDNIPPFVSLFGANDLDIGVLLDGDSDYQNRLERITDTGEISERNIKATTDFIDEAYGDIEDLFTESFYMKLVSRAYSRELLANEDVPDSIDTSDFKKDNKNPRLIKRVEKYFDRYHINDGIFEHAAPAKYLQENQDELKDEIDAESMDNFEVLFEAFNEILESFED